MTTNSLTVSFTTGDATTQGIRATFSNSGTGNIVFPPFTTFTVNDVEYYNVDTVTVLPGINNLVTLQKGVSATAGSSILLSALSVDYNSGKTQLRANLAASSAPWKAVLPTETGDTIVSLISTVHASAQQNILRSLQDVFPATAVSDSAIYAGAAMQGVRLNRKLSANIPVSITNKTAATITIPPYTSFAGANTYWFNREYIEVGAGQTLDSSSLHQGVVRSIGSSGLGTPYQVMASPESGFAVSDVDTFVFINGEAIPKLTTGLWTSKTGKGFIDKTLPTGELIVEFGDGVYGSAPGISDSITVLYTVTSGSSANSLNVLNKSITTSTVSGILVTARGNPSGGADETSAVRYKNIAAYSFGAFGSAVNKSQYLTTILEYPGIADAVTFSEREIFQSDPRLMNYVQVTYKLKEGVTWDSAATTTFINYLQENSNYSTRFNIVPPTPNLVAVQAEVYCKSWANLAQAKSASTAAVKKLFSQAGLNYDIMITDITTAILNSYSGIDYVDLVSPSKDAVVSTPWIPPPSLSLYSGGFLNAGAVAYAVGYTTYADIVTQGKNIAYTVITASNTSVSLSWAPVAAAKFYTIYGRGGLSSLWGVLATDVQVPFYVDTGLTTPESIPATSTSLPYNAVQYNALDTNNFSISTYYSQRSNASSTQG